MSRRGQTLLGLAVTLVLLWWTLHDVALGEVVDEILAADPWWLLATVVVATLTFVPRAMRWHVLLLPAHPETSSFRTPFGSRFGAVCIGAMANNLLPARLGEFARAFAFSRVEPLGMSATLASQVVERVFDGLVLAALLGTILLLPGSPLEAGAPQGGSLVRRAAWIGGGVFLAGTIGLWLIVRYPGTALRLFESTLGRVLSPDLTDRGLEVLASFIDGLGAVHHPGIFLRTLLWTLVVWLVSAASLWLGFLAFDIAVPGFRGAILLQALIGFAVAIPSSPGFFGPFEAATRLGLGLFGVEAARIVGFAMSYHLLTFVPVTLIGLWYVRRMGLRWSEVERSEEIVGAAVGGGDAGGGNGTPVDRPTGATPPTGSRPGESLDER